jgi:uncharacterized protein
MKLLIWLALIIVVVYLLRRATRRPPVIQSKRDDILEQEPMAQCAYCGVHFPASEAVSKSAAGPFCSAEHLRLHNRS